MRKPPQRYPSFRQQVDTFLSVLPWLEKGSVEALHRTRVASRRLREWLAVRERDGRDNRKLNRRLRKVTKQLGRVRELDVLMLLIDELTHDRRYAPAALEQIGAMVVAARTAARERLKAQFGTLKLNWVARKLTRVAEHFQSEDAKSRPTSTDSPWREWQAALHAQLVRRARAVQLAIDAAGAMYMAERLHDVRITIKRCRYAAELPTEARRQRTMADIRTLKQAQDLLGRLHDLEVLLGWIRKAQVSLAPPDLLAWRELRSLAHALEDDCREIHAGYMRRRVTLMILAERIAGRSPEAASTGERAAG